MGPSWGQAEGQESSSPQVEAGLPCVGMGELCSLPAGGLGHSLPVCV